MRICLKSFAHVGDAALLTPVIENLAKECENIEIGYSGGYGELFVGNPHVNLLITDRNADKVFSLRYDGNEHVGSAGTMARGNIICFEKKWKEATGEVIELDKNQGLKLYLKDEEKAPLKGLPEKYWVLNPNCQRRSMTKLYPYWQEVVDSLPGLTFVRIGGNESRDIQPKITGKNVVDYARKTTLRDLMRLVYCSQGVLTPPSGVLWLSLALPPEEGSRPVVCVNGTQEPATLTAFPEVRHVGGMKCPKGHDAKDGCRCFYVGNQGGTPGRTCLQKVKLGDREYAKCLVDLSPKKVIDAVEEVTEC